MSWTTPDYLHSPLYVIVPIFNPIRYKSRWKHYERFADHVKQSGGVLVTVEAAFGSRHHALQAGISQHEMPIYQEAPTKPTEFHKARTTEPHIYIRVRTDDEIWFKENLINIGISRLPEDWKYVAWVDGDVAFARPNWVGETIHQLQHYKLVQMFSESQDLGPRYASINHAQSFMSCHVKGIPRPTPRTDTQTVPYGSGGVPGLPGKYILWHPGFAWAARREAIDELGGLVDFARMGAADNHMAHALIGCVEDSFHHGVHPNYRKRLLEWQWRCDRYIRRNVGYVSGLLIHYWHGRKVDRRYWDRWRVIVENQYNPDLDVKYDWQGLLQLADRGEPRSITLRDDARRYFRARNEDSIELTGTADLE
jgi:hypothetical protein